MRVHPDESLVVIIASPTDPCASLVREHLRDRGADVAFVDRSEFLTTSGLSWRPCRPEDESFLVVGSRRVPLTAITGLLNRWRRPAPADGDLPAGDREYVDAEQRATALAFFNALGSPVVNRPVPGRPDGPIVAGLETRRIRDRGFRLPATLVTSRHDSAARFFARHGQMATVRSLVGPDPGRTIAGDEGARQLEEIAASGPVCLQEVSPGRALRVFVVADRAFATPGSDGARAEDGRATDGSPPGSAELSPGLGERCCRLVRDLQSSFASVDLRQTERGETYCYGVDPFPAFEPGEARLPDEAAAALAELLVGERVPEQVG